ncbi:ABC transporter substrate-binding protein [Macrococcus equipercicus]|uniref:Helix-turn-helix domain-containing protein n=1 Tax=Macrococcus equipercicus TaxID=69967 RepID=A0A9Q9BPW1_9STAP|nr:ABC transporter substrate-binding protein [Macrococcus equipercicus]KAA1036581.1 helix-turn-helix domain-containing protein [Macrococcus equipercicus]UTH13486.1 SgrR family transcriptional regulator [Macrococcus equipercicus]
MDIKLLLLKDYIAGANRTREQIAEYLNVSSRQLTRMLKKWENEGLIDYKAGNGRGNNSKIDFKMDVEEQVIDYFFGAIEKKSIEEITQLLKLPLPQRVKRQIHTVINDAVANARNEKCYIYPDFSYMEYISFIPSSYHPLTLLDPNTSLIIVNTMSRLYHFNEKGDIQPFLVIFEEWHENILTLHLKRNVKFSDGTVMNARCVATCLNELITHERYKRFFSTVECIKASGLYTVEITGTQHIDSIREKLTTLPASIYKEKEGEYIGTGPYCIAERQRDTLKLESNLFYFNNTSDITTLWLTTDKEEYNDFLKARQFTELTADEVVSMESFIFNPRSDRLNIKQRRYLSLRIMDYFAQQGGTSSCRLFDTYLSALERIRDNEVIFSDAVKILVRQDSDHHLKLTDYLQSAGIPLEVVMTSSHDFKYMHLDDSDADIIGMNEIYEPDRLFYGWLQCSKFKEWFKDMACSTKLRYIYTNRHAAYWPYAERMYGDYLMKQALFIPVYRIEHHYRFPSSFKNVRPGHFGIVDYSKIIVTAA